MNAGCLEPIEIVIPEGSMLAPQYPRAVVAGNVETSQHVTNALFGALGALSSAQGSMNNLTFGNEKYQYYETICSGSPAGVFNSGEGFDGTDGVHTHMTNSRLTDPEVLEMRFPVLLEDFHIRRSRDERPLPLREVSAAARGGGKLGLAAPHPAAPRPPPRRGEGMPARRAGNSAGTARCARCASWRGWTAPSSPRTGPSARTGSSAASRASSARPSCAATDGRLEELAGLRPDGAGGGRSGDRQDADGGRVRGAGAVERSQSSHRVGG